MGHTFNREVYKVGAYDDTFRCPVCDGTIILSEVNSVSAMRPELTALWSAENEMSPDETFYNRQSLRIMELSRMSWHVSDEDQ